MKSGGQTHEEEVKRVGKNVRFTYWLIMPQPVYRGGGNLPHAPLIKC